MVLEILLATSVLGLGIVTYLFFKEQSVTNRFRKKLRKLETHVSKIEGSHKRLEHKLKQVVKDYELLVQQKEGGLQYSREAAKQQFRTLLEEVPVSEIMTKKVVTINVDAPFGDVARKMRENTIRHLPVVDGENKLVGIITQLMLYQIQSPRKTIDGEWVYDENSLNNIILKHVMNRDVYTLFPEQAMGKALVKMVYSRFGCVPVIQPDNTLIGVVTRKDLLMVSAEIYENKR